LISARGGAVSGNGGFIETSGHRYLDINGIHVDTRAANGAMGTWLLDPANITIQSNNGSNSNIGFNSGTYSPTSGANTSIIDVNNLIAALNSSNVTVTTTNSGASGGA